MGRILDIIIFIFAWVMLFFTNFISSTHTYSTEQERIIYVVTAILFNAMFFLRQNFSSTYSHNRHIKKIIIINILLVITYFLYNYFLAETFTIRISEIVAYATLLNALYLIITSIIFFYLDSIAGTGIGRFFLTAIFVIFILWIGQMSMSAIYH